MARKVKNPLSFGVSVETESARASLTGLGKAFDETSVKVAQLGKVVDAAENAIRTDVGKAAAELLKLTDQMHKAYQARADAAAAAAEKENRTRDRTRASLANFSAATRTAIQSVRQQTTASDRASVALTKLGAAAGEADKRTQAFTRTLREKKQATGEASAKTTALSVAYLAMASKAELAWRAVQKVTDGVMHVVGEYVKAEHALRELEGGLEAYGIRTKENIKASDDYAKALERKLGIDADDILSMRAKLLLLGVLPENLDAASNAALGWARIMRKDLVVAANDIDKALHGNVRIFKAFNASLKTPQAVMDFTRRGMFLLAQDAESLEGRMQATKLAVGEFEEALGKTFDTPKTHETLNRMAQAFRDMAAAITTSAAEATKLDTALRELDAAKTPEQIHGPAQRAREAVQARERHPWYVADFGPHAPGVERRIEEATKRVRPVAGGYGPTVDAPKPDVWRLPKPILSPRRSPDAEAEYQRRLAYYNRTTGKYYRPFMGPVLPTSGEFSTQIVVEQESAEKKAAREAKERREREKAAREKKAAAQARIEAAKKAVLVKQAQEVLTYEALARAPEGELSFEEATAKAKGAPNKDIELAITRIGEFQHALKEAREEYARFLTTRGENIAYTPTAATHIAYTNTDFAPPMARMFLKTRLATEEEKVTEKLQSEQRATDLQNLKAQEDAAKALWDKETANITATATIKKDRVAERPYTATLRGPVDKEHPAPPVRSPRTAREVDDEMEIILMEKKAREEAQEDSDKRRMARERIMIQGFTQLMSQGLSTVTDTFIDGFFDGFQDGWEDAMAKNLAKQAVKTGLSVGFALVGTAIGGKTGGTAGGFLGDVIGEVFSGGKATGGPIGAPRGYARGGFVVGQEGYDQNLARLTKGEYVLSVPTVNAIKKGMSLPYPGAQPNPSDSTSRSPSGGITINMNYAFPTGRADHERLIKRDLLPALKRLQQGGY